VPYANMANPQTLNLYAMVSDNPETFADLDGHCPGPNPSCDQTGGREMNASPCLNIPGSNGDCNPIGDNTPPDPGSALSSPTTQQHNTVKPVAQNQTAPKTGFWHRLGQRFNNFFHGHGFVTNLGLKSSVTTTQTYNFIIRESEPNPVVTAVADAIGVAGAVGRNVKLGAAGAVISVVNDPSALNLTLTGLSLVPGLDVPIAFGSAAWDASKFASEVVNGVSPQTRYSHKR